MAAMHNVPTLGILTAMFFGESLAFAQCPQIGWSEVGGGTNSPVLAMTTFDDGTGEALYVGGTFGTAGGVSANSIAKWDGTAWSPLGTGANGSVSALAFFDDGHGDGPVLFAGGEFSIAGGVVSMYIARWDGTQWSRLSDDWYLNGSVSSMAVFDDGSGPALYVSGAFNSIQGIPVHHIFKWDGKSWSQVGDGLGITGARAMLSFDDGSGNGTELFCTGGFTTAGGEAANRIAKWNGIRWSPLGTGLEGTPAIGYALAGIPSGRMRGLYVGGDFATAGGVASPKLARWDGSQGNAVVDPAVPSKTVTALAAFQDVSRTLLYAARNFMLIYDNQVYPIRVWDGSNWTPLSHGLNHITRTLVIGHQSPGEVLYAGGDFNTSNVVIGALVNRVASWYPIGSYQDCNQNRVDDACDVAVGSGHDCNANGTMDECEMPMTYALDNNQLASVWGLAGGAAWMWLNQFEVVPGGQMVTHIALPWSLLAPDGLTVHLLVYDDPNNDGNPADAVLLSQVEVDNFNGLSPGDPLTLAKVQIPPTYVGDVGDKFFIAGMVQHPNPLSAPYIFIAGADTSPPTVSKSWSKYVQLGSINIEDLSQGGGGPPELFGQNWILRAISADCNGNGIWDECDIADGISRDANQNGIPDECETISCPADIAPRGGDHTVNVADLLAVINSWGQCADPCPPCAADISGDCNVNAADLLAIINAWGRCP